MSYIALRLDGNGYASIADASQAGLDMGLSDFMLEARVKLTVPTVNQPETYSCLFDKYVITGLYEVFLESAAEKIWFNIKDAGPSARGLECASSYIDDLKWHNLIFVADRDQITGLELYIDGAEVTYLNQLDPTSVGSLDNNAVFAIGATGTVFDSKMNGQMDEVRVWNFGYGGLPADYATYIAWRAAGRNVFLDISNYSSGSWNLYADAVRTELHDGAGTVAGMVVGKKYGYVTATPHTLDYTGGTLEDNGVFTATHTTGTIASGDANDHVRRVGLVARWKFEGNYLDEGSNDNDLTAGGTGNAFPTYTLKPHKIISPLTGWLK